MASLRELLCRLLCPQREYTIREFESPLELAAFIQDQMYLIEPQTDEFWHHGPLD